MSNPFKFSQLKMSHLKRKKNGNNNAFHMSQDFPDYNWQKPKSYSLKQKDYLLENDKRGSKTPKDSWL